MNIAYSSSEYYFKPTCVSIYSLLINSKETHKIILLSSGVCDKSKRDLRNIVEGLGSTLLVLEIDGLLEYYAAKLRLPKMRGSYSTYARIFLTELLPDFTEVLLIDSDTLIIKDISLISKIDDDVAMMACRDYVISNKFSRHEDPDLSRLAYYNMGVLYVNLVFWRDNNLLEKLVKTYDKEFTPMIADQTIVNKYFNEYIEPLSVIFNCYTYLHYGFDYLFYKSQNNNDTLFMPEIEFNSAKSGPVILHFIGAWYERPWFKFNINPHVKAYLDYWVKCFKLSELFDRPKLSLASFIYDYSSIFIHYWFGKKAYFLFRYKFIQLIKFRFN